MNDASKPLSETVFADEADGVVNPRSRLLLQLVLWVLLAAAICTVGYVTYRAALEHARLSSQPPLMSFHGLTSPAQRKLDARYTDADGDLVADVPADRAEVLNPEGLVLAYYTGDYEDEGRIDWQGLRDLISKEAERPVQLRTYMHTVEEVEAVREGRIHIVAAHSAEVPCLVNTAGFVPLAVLGSEEGVNGNHSVIAVSHNSEVQQLEDLKGKTLVFTQADSITGYRAPIALLWREAKLQPNKDYGIYYSNGQGHSVRGLEAGTFKAVAISSDVLQRLLAKGKILESDYRVIYESRIIPRITLGCIHKLDPQLVGRICAATLSFANDATEEDDVEKTRMRFFPANYRQEFAFVRTLDELFDPRFGRIYAAEMSQ